MARETTLTERAYQRLKSDVLTCRMLPGERINMKETGTTLGCSPGAIREALARLSSEGLVDADEQRGFRVAAISVSDLRDLVTTRIEIESGCLARAIRHGDLGWEANIAAAAHRLSRTPVERTGENRINPDYAVAHAAFHDALVAACDSPWLLRIRAMLYAQSERYRSLAVPFARNERDIDDEHVQLAANVLARDEQAALPLLDRHLRRTAQTLIDAIGGAAPTSTLVFPSREDELLPAVR